MLALKADDVSALTLRGVAYGVKGDYARAVADYARAIAIDPHNVFTLYRRGAAKLKLGDAAGGEADIAAAKRMRPDVAEEFTRRGMR